MNANILQTAPNSFQMHPAAQESFHWLWIAAVLDYICTTSTATAIVWRVYPKKNERVAVTLLTSLVPNVGLAVAMAELHT